MVEVNLPAPHGTCPRFHGPDLGARGWRERQKPGELLSVPQVLHDVEAGALFRKKPSAPSAPALMVLTWLGMM
jgi:hypothetical protein